MGESVPESGSLFGATLQPMRDLSGKGSTVVVTEAEVEKNFRMPWAHHVLRAALNAAHVRQDRDSNFLLYAGGEDSFPYSLRSSYRLMGYPPNALAADRLALGSLRYVVPLRTLERGFSSLPFFLDRLNLFLCAEGGVLERNGRRVYPFSYGAALAGDVDVGWIWPTQWSLGVYQGKESTGGERRVVFSIGFQP
jgi:hypothetical protein